MDRRILAAIALMMAIAILPAVFFKRPPPARVPADTVAMSPEPPAAPAPTLPAEQAAPLDTASPDAVPDSATGEPERIIRVHSPLYEYAFSNRGARLVEATMRRYRSMAPSDRGADAQLLPDLSRLLGLRLVAGQDTVGLDEWDFEPSTEDLAADAGAPLVLTASRGGLTVRLEYGFRPDDYVVTVSGTIQGIGPNGGTLLVGLGPGLRNTESDSADNQNSLGIVTKARGETEVTPFRKLDAGVTRDLSGPFEWVAVKSKYFVTALFAIDTLETTFDGRLAGVRAVPPAGQRRVSVAQVVTSLPVPASGAFRYTLYAGPMEYPRLRAFGHDFYDVNPYGWPGFRAIIRPVAAAARWLLVWMHEQLGIAYGLALILFGIAVRVALWPLNQKAMRASMQQQAIQPLLKDIQDRYKDDPQRLQQEMFKLYREHKINPFGGCWPMLLPMPILFALFFVFLNTIELRGAPFLWLSDLSRPDPLYIIPVVMGLSMYLVSRIGQIGMQPNPQMKMMLYVMPVMMTVLFLRFASGLNLYYTVQNLASIPQQWMLSKERLKAAPPAPPPPEKRKTKRR